MSIRFEEPSVVNVLTGHYYRAFLSVMYESPIRKDNAYETHVESFFVKLGL